MRIGRRPPPSSALRGTADDTSPGGGGKSVVRNCTGVGAFCTPFVILSEAQRSRKIFFLVPERFFGSASLRSE